MAPYDASVTIVQLALVAVLAAAAGSTVAAFVLGWRAQRQGDPKPSANQGLTVSAVLNMVVRSAPMGIVVVDQFRDVLLVNRQAEELGLVRQQLLDERAWQAVEQVLRTGDSMEFDVADKSRQLGRKPMAVRGRVQLLTREGPELAVVFAEDDSEQVRMEAARRDFVANVSHELKTPVGAMSLLSEALLESLDDEESVRHFAQRLHGESIRLGTMVTELIALSRLQGAEKLPDLTVVDVDTVVSQSVARSAVAAERAQITVTTDFPSGLEVLGDQTLLVTALSNLVENAVAYSSPGSPVTISRNMRDGNVEISVTDRGIGIPKEYQERVFERFFRLDKARSRATGGTGLGLAIVKHVLANHNGMVRLWSRPGTGSTFTLVLPAYVEPGGDEVASGPSAGAIREEVQNR